jgi:HlyD family secretion protein
MTATKSKKRLWIIIGGVVILAVIIVLAVIKGKGTEGTKVATEKVVKRTITQSVSANGKIQPEKDIKISPYISGEVIELTVKEGDQVKQGALMAKIDPEIYVSIYDQSVASLNTQKAQEANAHARQAQLKAQFDQAKQNLDRKSVV